MTSAPSLRPLCGLTQEKVLSLATLGVPVVDGDCQNGYIDADGRRQKCGMPVGAHPSELTAQAIAPPAEDALIKKVVKFSVLARPKQIRVIHWLDGTIKLIDVYDEDETAYDGFMRSIENAFDLYDSFRVYALTPPSYAWKERCEVVKLSFGDVLSNVNAPIYERLKLYMLPSAVSPESSPLQLKKKRK